MKTKQLIRDLAIHRKLSKESPRPEARAYHLAEFQRAALQLAHHQADTWDRQARTINQKASEIRARLSLAA